MFILLNCMITRPVGKIIDSLKKKLSFLKDSCDGSGLNTSENSKDSHPYISKGFFSDIVRLSYLHTMSLKDLILWALTKLFFVFV